MTALRTKLAKLTLVALSAALTLALAVQPVFAAKYTP